MKSAVVLFSCIALLCLALGSGHLASRLAAFHPAGRDVAVAGR